MHVDALWKYHRRKLYCNCYFQEKIGDTKYNSTDKANNINSVHF